MIFAIFLFWNETHRLIPCSRTNSSQEFQEIYEFECRQNDKKIHFSTYHESLLACATTKEHDIEDSFTDTKLWTNTLKEHVKAIGLEKNEFDIGIYQKQFLALFNYQNSHPRIKIHHFFIKTCSSSKELSTQPLMKEYNPVVWENYELETEICKN